MGHSRYDSLPKSKQWSQLIEAFSRLASIPQELVQQTSRAAEKQLLGTRDDPFVSTACWLLVQIPTLARKNALDEWIREQAPTSTGDYRRDIGSAARRQMERAAAKNPPRSIFSETAKLAFFETLASAFKEANLVLFGADKEEVRKALSRYATPEGFQVLARSFFKAYLQRSLGNFLEKELPNHLGIAERFAQARDAAAVQETLAGYCQEATALLSQYSRDWYAKNVIHAKPSETTAKGFAAYAVQKLVEDLPRERIQ
jgi:hypothetical protein